MWYYIDSKNCILGSNPNDMAGNTGWVELDCAITDLSNADGVPIYKVVDGKAVKRTSAEIAADTPAAPEPPLTMDEVLSVLEAALNG